MKEEFTEPVCLDMKRYEKHRSDTPEPEKRPKDHPKMGPIFTSVSVCCSAQAAAETFGGGLSISLLPGLDTRRSFTPGSTPEAPGCQIHSRLNGSDWRSAASSLHCHVHLFR